jgi:hypothetical protein
MVDDSVKGKVMGEVKDIYSGDRKSTIWLEVSQASPVRPSDKGSVEVKTLEWLEAVA